MKKLRFFVVLIVPLVMVLSFNIILAGFSVSPVQARQLTNQPETILHSSSIISDIDLLANDPVTGLAITHSTPVDIDEPVFFTATVTGGTEPIFYSWNFDDGAGIIFPNPLTNNSISHTFDMTGAYTIILSATNFSLDPLVTTSLVLTVTDLPEPPPPNVLIDHSTPVLVGEPTVFTATVISGTKPIFFSWDFGDGNEGVIPNPPTATTIIHTYQSVGDFTVTLSATNFSANPVGSASKLVRVGDTNPASRRNIFLPVLFKNQGPPKPDLICTYALDPPTTGAGDQVLITVQIKNQGQLEADGFWVDAYFNPTNIPSQNNLGRWQDACGGLNSCTTGIAWGIGDAPVAPGSSRILISTNDDEDPNTNGYDPKHTKWTGSLPTSPDKIFIYVDSINNNDGLNDGAVSESNEGNNLCKKVDEIEMTANDVIVSQRSRSNLPAR